MPSYVIGVDFGTESGRAVVIDASDGHELGSSVYPYSNGVIDEALPAPDADVKLAPEWALQDPDDYLRTFQQAVPAAIAEAGVDAADVIGVGIDFDGHAWGMSYNNSTATRIDLDNLDRFRLNQVLEENSVGHMFA